MWYLFIPYLYGFNSRAKTAVHRCSFFALIFMPIFINAMLLDGQMCSLPILFLGFTAMYCVYEIGYIYNDVYTVTKEETPTKWLSHEKDDYVKDKFPLLVSSRVVWSVLSVSILLKFQADNIVGFMICLCLINLAFALHNYFRGKENVFTNGALQFLKYISVLLLFGTGTDLILYCCFIYFEIAFERTIEFAIVKGYFFNKLQNVDMDNFRIVYYLIIVGVAIVFSFFGNIFKGFLLGSIYLLLYRIVCKLLTLNSKVLTSRSKQ